MRYVLSQVLCALLIAFGLALAPAGSASASNDLLADLMAAEAANPDFFKVCPVSDRTPNTFALCFDAPCWTVDNVAYCKCDILNQPSISLPYPYREDGKKKNICNLLKEGLDNGFTMSTYATPRQMVKDYNQAEERLGPPAAMYTCQGDRNAAASYSAQCDGGVCFKSTSGQDFPGLGRVKKDQIVCSCPAVDNYPVPYQIAGPWSCAPGDPNLDGHCCSQSYHDQYCGVTSVRKTGTQITISAPVGFASNLSTILDGVAPQFNNCNFVQ